MTRDQAKREVIRLYNTEYLKILGGLESRSDVVGALPFYNWLKKSHPEVADFEYPGDRYQIIKTWIGLP